MTKELHVFSDASEKAIAAVTYLRTTDIEGQVKLGFVLCKAKVAPISGHTIPIVTQQTLQQDVYLQLNLKTALGYKDQNN